MLSITRSAGLCFCIVFYCALHAIAQTPVAGFTAPSLVCLSQQVIPVNTSSNAVRHEWDFCQGDLGLAPSVSYLGAIGGAVTLGVDVVFDDLNWFGFVTSRETNSIIRLDFGTDNSSTPVRTDLGNISGNLGRPIDIRIVKDGGNWYGFVYSEATANTLITRIDFGTSLQNTTASPFPVTATVVVPGNGIFNSNGGFDMVKSGNEWTIVYTQPSSVGIIRLSTITSIPAGTDMILSPALTGSVGSTTLGDLKLIKSGGAWFGYTSDFQNRELYRLTFGASVFSQPSSVNLGSSWMNGQTPYGLDGGFDNGNYYLLISTLSGNLQRINLGPDLSTNPVSAVSLGNSSLLSNTFKIKLFNHNSQWVAFTVDYSNQHFYRIPFPAGSCSTAPSFSILAAPTIVYTSPASAFITLRSFDSDGNSDEISSAVTVLSGTAPVLDFQSQNSCAQFPVLFTAQSAQALHGYQWDFGNSDTSTQATPSEIFTASGTYTVSFSAIAPNGCSNLVKRSLDIFNVPNAGFTVPSPALSCTNQQYDFVNSSSADMGSSPLWQWNVDGLPVAVTKDLQVSFPGVTNHSVQLIASIPGCSTQVTQAFLVQQTGPVVDFDISGNCEGKAITFTNNSTGTISGYSWDFDDGQTSVAPSPTHVFAAIGAYTVRLTASNPLGCDNTVTKQVPVYSTPQPLFSLELPPFSCSGSPSQFTDTTPLMTDSNIVSWTWNFGDANGGTSGDQNPVYTYDDAAQYTVLYSVTTDRGCSALLQKDITIEQTPAATFNNTPACIGKETQFSDASPVGMKTWAWIIDGTVSVLQNPVHTFSSAADYPVQLSVTAPNNCIGKTSRTIVVPAVLAPKFSVTNACAGQAAVFTNTTAPSSDGIEQVSWNFNGSGNATGSPVLFTFDETGEQSVTLTTETQSGCVYTASQAVDITPLPTAGFSASVEQGPAPLSVKFTNTSSGASAFTWNIDGTNSSAISPLYVFSEPGDYTVELLASNAAGCQGAASEVIHVSAPPSESIHDPWPVPAHGILHLDWIVPTAGTMEVSVYSVLGVHAVDRSQAASVPGLNQFAVDVSGLPPGIYIVQLQGHGLLKKFKIIVE